MRGISQEDFRASLTDIRALITLVIASQAVAFLSLAPVWLFGCLLFYTIFLYVPQLSDSKFLRFALVLVTVALFAIDYGIAYSVEMAGVFLLLVASMKAIELKSARDVLVFVYAMFYLAAVSMIFEQSIGHVMLQLVAVMLCFALLMRLNDSSLGSVRSHIWRVVKLLSLALPIAISLFLFFPRMAPLWSLPIKTSHSQTGMSEAMTPGSIAELTQSAERAFRVTFNGETPPRSQLYWRAMILDQFNGRTWSRSNDALMAERARAGLITQRKYEQYKPQNIDGNFYDVILEPHQNRWAFALAGSAPISGNVHKIGGGVYEFTQDVVAPTPYRMTHEPSWTSSSVIPGARVLSGVERVAGLSYQDVMLPKGGNPRARAFVTQLLSSGPTESEFIRSILEYYATQEFGYTLKPPRLGGDSVDEFLFDTRLGFCEHYASSMTFLLREAGIPSRVVVGYQGGEFNENLGYWVIRQYDAHAWVEAYVEGTGWVRIDPTAYIAPDRVERNLEEAVRSEGTFLADNRMAALTRSVAFLNWVSRQADEMNYRWQRFVVGYGEQDQRALLERFLGHFDLRSLIWVLVTLVGIASAIILIYIWLGRYDRTLSKPERKYLRFLVLLRVFGVSRQLGETPNRFAERVKPDINPAAYKALAHRTLALHKSLYNVRQSNDRHSDDNAK